jgi:hypothetical protein
MTARGSQNRRPPSQARNKYRSHFAPRKGGRKRARPPSPFLSCGRVVLWHNLLRIRTILAVCLWVALNSMHGSHQVIDLSPFPLLAITSIAGGRAVDLVRSEKSSLAKDLRRKFVGYYAEDASTGQEEVGILYARRPDLITSRA